MTQSNRPGLFLDLDGTLADSLGVMKDIYDRFLASFDRPSSQAEFDRLNGPSLADVIAILKRDHELDPPVEDLLKVYKKYLNAVYRDVKPCPGARELIYAAVAEGWAVNVVSSNVGDTVASWLDAVELSDFISTIATGDMVSRGKPAPDLYLKAIEDSQCDVARSIAVEDTLTGVRSAAGAGLTTCAIVSGSACGIDWPGGVRTITSLNQLLPLPRFEKVGSSPNV